MSGQGFAGSAVLSGLVLLFSSVVCADSGVTEAVPAEPQNLNETGFGPVPFFSVVLTGEFIVAGSNARGSYLSAPPTPTPPPQTDPFVISIADIPGGSTVVRAFANWSYLANKPYPQELAAITINSNPVTGELTGEAEATLCWDSTSRTIAYTADVTDVVNQVGGNGDYTIGSGVDPMPPPNPLWLGEGFSLLIVYQNTSLPWKQINVYSGMITTETGSISGVADSTLGFHPDPYWGGETHFFLNALDGQIAGDEFYLNGISAGGVVAGTVSELDAWQGLLGQGVQNSMYDHVEDDVAAFMSSDDDSVTIQTISSGFFRDCIGHSFGAIAFDTPAPCTGSDADGDGWPDVCDNCPSTPNADQADCNQNGVGDACVPDCDDNGVPDDCDPDCNNNGIPDACDITAETSQDCNENGLADECEPECTGNGVPDDCDIALGTVQDCNHNHVPDLCDIASGTSQDGNTNGVPDECENPSISKVRINEVFANPLNPPNPRPDFVELYGLPGTNLDGLSLLLIQSDQGAASGQGRRIAISGTLPADGLWVLGSAGTPNVDQEVISDIGSGAETFMLVSGFSGSSFFDIDQDNNCSLDWILPVTIGTTIDIVAIADAGTNCYFFPSPRIGPAADGGAPGGIARRFDGHDTNGVEDWCISSKEFIPPDTGRDSYGYNAASPGLSNPSDCDCIAGPPTIVAAHSYKWHGAAGNHGIDLLAPIGGYADAVECRVGGPTYVVVTFNQPVMGFDGLDRTDVTVSSGLVANLFIAGDNLTPK